MGTTLTFADSLHPQRWRVFGRRLQPVSAGHLLALDQLGLIDGSMTVPALIAAVVFCSRPYRLGSDFRLTLRDRLFATAISALRVIRPAVIESRAVMFRDYIADGMSVPETYRGAGPDRPSGAPWLAHYITSLLGIGVDLERALSMPMAFGTWLIVTAGEKRGTTQVQTEHERRVSEAADRGEILESEPATIVPGA